MAWPITSSYVVGNCTSDISLKISPSGKKSRSALPLQGLKSISELVSIVAWSCPRRCSHTSEGSETWWNSNHIQQGKIQIYTNVHHSYANSSTRQRWLPDQSGKDWELAVNEIYSGWNAERYWWLPLKNWNSSKEHTSVVRRFTCSKWHCNNSLQIRSFSESTISPARNFHRRISKAPSE